jgi:hypothetical protein
VNADFSRHPLARQAASILEGAGYNTAPIVLPDTKALLVVAESVYAVVGVVGAEEWSELAIDIDNLTTDFANWALSRKPEAKQWDLYLLLVIAQPLTRDADVAQAEQFANDTRYVRRLVRHGVASEHPGAVHTALAALLPLRLPERISERDPYAALVEALRGRGVDGHLAFQTVEQFLAATGIDL